MFTVESTVEAFGYPIFNDSWDAIMDKAMSLTQSPGFKTIVTLNPQILSLCQKDKDLANYLSDADLILPESRGLTWAIQQLTGDRLQRRPGVELLPRLFEKMDSVYLIGGQDKQLASFSEQLEKQYPHLSVLGSHHGYFDLDSIFSIAQEIRRLSPQFILVGMGAPLQERVLSRLSRLCETGVGIGVGGSFDVLSAVKKRAPNWVQDKGLEWLYRGFKEPKRLRTWGYMPGFVLKTLFNKTKCEKEGVSL